MSELVCRPYIELMADKLSPLSYGLEMGCSNAASLKQLVRNFGNLLFQNPSSKLASQNFGSLCLFLDSIVNGLKERED